MEIRGIIIVKLPNWNVNILEYYEQIKKKQDSKITKLECKFVQKS
ncbi:hypothetical protein HMPREF9630_01541 [Peptoanaerobacter stomatis]|uniref:Uncharacterized protein n=1 Tax=Peptoanaerobacter stomatis TaxID=796937 RepID=V9HKT1_9FIRM|nr:hypothetical protein HMPREF9630_01541 [Peptoanaerobacter stomatis]